MKDFQLRVVEEKRQLDLRISKLTAFLGSPEHNNLCKEEQELLCVQLGAMASYSVVLRTRIERF